MGGGAWYRKYSYERVDGSISANPTESARALYSAASAVAAVAAVAAAAAAAAVARHLVVGRSAGAGGLARGVPAFEPTDHVGVPLAGRVAEGWPG